MRTQESDHSGARAILPATRLTRLCVVGGAFYLVVAFLIGLFFAGRFISEGFAPWFLVFPLLGGGGMAAAGAWMIWAALRGAPKRHASWFRHLVSAAVAGLLWAPFELLQEVQGFDGFLVAGASVPSH